MKRWLWLFFGNFAITLGCSRTAFMPDGGFRGVDKPSKGQTEIESAGKGTGDSESAGASEGSERSTTEPGSSPQNVDEQPDLSSVAMRNGSNPCDPTEMGGLIDFESLPDGSAPSPGLPITNQFLKSHGVSFSMENGAAPTLAGGNFMDAFTGGCQQQNRDGSCAFGKFMLGTNRQPEALIITFEIETAKASGVIVDIDDRESWSVEAFDRNGSLLEKLEFDYRTIAAGGDGKGTPWSFDRGNTREIRSIRLTGRKGQSRMGLAFDHFSPSGICRFGAI